jgi:4-hydroxy-3-methylbut-2-enyl diphosphate reductase
VEACLKETGAANYTYGEIMHNRSVVEDFKTRGAIPVTAIEDVPDGATLVIRSHGVTPDVYNACNARGITIKDATCPFVKRIHNIVADAHKRGMQVIIIGKHDHPEVIGINGWCDDSAIILADETECDTLPEMENVCMVIQTTMPLEKFNAIAERVRLKSRNIEIFNTICNTTTIRQSEAAELASRCDCVIVIGGHNSSNTQKLVEICTKLCKYTVNIENPSELSLEKMHFNAIIGVVAGASTPDWMIREVVTIMSELENAGNGIPQDATTEVAAASTEPIDAQAVADAVEEPTAVAAEPATEPQEENDDNFEAAFEKTMRQIRSGQIIKGTVVLVSENEVCVNIGYKSDGLIPRSEFSSIDVDPTTEVKPGDEIEVEVIKVNDGEGNVLLSRKSLESKKQWEALINSYEEDPNKVFDGIGKEAVKGGLIASISGVRTFIPASHLYTKYVENIDEFIGKPLKLKIIDIEKAKKRIVASQKEVLLAEAESKKKEILAGLKENDKIHCVVRRLTDFGAFVDIGGVDGLIHVTNMAWGRVKHPSDVLKIGQEIDAVILSVDVEKERVSLGYKQLQPKPWMLAADKYPVGSVVEGKVVRIVPFGAFVSLEPSIDGLVHISQVSTSRIAKVEDVLKVGDMVRAKVLEVNPKAKRISLSIKEVLLDENPELAEQLEKERAERIAKRTAERERINAERAATNEKHQAVRSEHPARSERRSERPSRSNDEGAGFDLPPVKQTTVSLADFFPKFDDLDDTSEDE